MKTKHTYQKNVRLVRYITSFALLFVTSSCEKYLDVKQNSQISILKTVNDCQLLLNDYSLNSSYPFDNETSSDDYFVYDSRLSQEPIQQEDKDIYTWKSNAIRATSGTQWVPPYHVCYVANLVLETLDDLPDNDRGIEINNVRGQALFFRAFSSWSVAQLYARPFQEESASQYPGIPIHLTSDINEKSERATVSSTYNRILTDLKDAADLLPMVSDIPSRPNKVAALAMIARVYLSMEKYSDALTYSNLALTQYSDLIDYNTIDTTSITPFIRFNKEVIFHAIMYPGTIAGPRLENGPQQVANVNPSLISLYDENDLRSKIFFKRNPDDSNISYFFSGNYEPSADSRFFTGLAVDELYLIRAECHARTGNINSALTDVNTLLRSRWKTGTFINKVAGNVESALELILTERRKELLFRGLRWTDLRRLNRDARFAVTLTRVVDGVSYNIPPNDPRYTLLIPQDVITISGIPQNTR